ncbi:653_t:CDS:2 [Funneliformis geosporum]|uniref:653_t:CDS:1 n=1 Tax=Funneliformis geosporum TaxID=1117311 RepID=A0A9W4WMY8_9GLOM|nr:653_t:CDS:2 [Funneliformis geosporum]
MRSGREEPGSKEKLINLENELTSCKHDLELQKEKMKQELVKERENYEKTIKSLEQLNKKQEKNILQLQQSLENYVTHLKPNIDIDIEKVRILAQEYGCLDEINVENPNKPFIKAILQCKVLDQVQFLSYILSNYRGSDFSLKLDINLKT